MNLSGIITSYSEVDFMAQEYIVIKEKTEQSGLIALSKSVFESIAKISVEEVEGCILVMQRRQLSAELSTIVCMLLLMQK